MQVITIENQKTKDFAVIEPKTKMIVWVSDKGLQELILEVLKSKPRAREEIFDTKNDRIVMCLREVSYDDPLYPLALQQEFERRGFFAQLVSGQAAKLQMILRRSPLPRDLQNKIVYRLRRLTDPQAEQILAELRST